jgi:glycine oxidase
VEGFDATVLAAGYETRRWIDVAPALAALQPIKGHVLHFQGGPTGGATVRGPAGYAAPQRTGVVFGATMEPGRADLALDTTAVADLHAAAIEMLPVLAAVPFAARTGVRAATPDGRPLVGPVADRLWLATGARRNGWLLAPLIAQAVVEGLQGRAVRGEFRAARSGAAAPPPVGPELF